jgi:hypothetical protein
MPEVTAAPPDSDDHSGCADDSSFDGRTQQYHRSSRSIVM